MAQATRILQLPSVRQCECPTCWRKLRSVPRDHELHKTKNSVVYEEHNSLTGKKRCSTDGRYMFYLSRMKELHIVDLVRNTRQMLKPQRPWPFFHFIHDFVIVNFKTLLVHVNYYDEVDALLLIRLRDADGIYDRVLLHRLEDYSPASFVLTEISGQNVEVERAVLNSEGHCSRFVFLSVNIDEARALVHHEATLNEDINFLCAQMNSNGRELQAVNDEEPTVLYVYSLGQRNWTREALDVQMLCGKKVLSGFTSSMPEMYLLGHEEQNVWSPWIFRCNLAARKWEGVAIGEYGAQHVASIVNPLDGEIDGIIVIKACQMPPIDRQPPTMRFKVERLMFRRPDPLKQLALMAFRKSREGMVGEESFHSQINKPPLKVQLQNSAPVHYQHMEPIIVGHIN